MEARNSKRLLRSDIQRRLRELRLFFLEKRRLSVHLITLNKYLVEKVKKMERSLVKVSQGQDKRQEFPFQHKRKKLRMVKSWNRFPTKVSPFCVKGVSIFSEVSKPDQMQSWATWNPYSSKGVVLGELQRSPPTSNILVVLTNSISAPPLSHAGTSQFSCPQS